MSVVGKVILARRKQLGYSRRALADRVGVTVQAVANWESQEDREPSKALLPKIADFLGLSVDSLFSGASIARFSVEETHLRNEAVLSSDEVQLLRAFRAADSVEKALILRMMSALQDPPD